MRRKLIYWGIPILGAVIGTIWTIRLLRRGELFEALDNQVDAVGGAIIWFSITILLQLIFLLDRPAFN